jgi:P pilus assembly chaperone PapD
MRVSRPLWTAAILMTLGIFVPTADARAELALSQLVVELTPGDRARADVEIWNNDPERAYVATEPREVFNPGTSSELRKGDPDPEKLGLLVSPTQMILEPGQRRLLRIAAIAPPSEVERIYRVTVKPVVGQLSASKSGLKVLIGYDVLVIVRPKHPNPHFSGSRTGDRLILKNDGNVSVELTDGKQCDINGNSCTVLPGGRLYAKAQRTIDAGANRQVQYKIKFGAKIIAARF